MSIGQIFGSAIGGALGGNSLAGNLTTGAIGGLIGQKFVQVLAIAMTTDLSKVSVAGVFAGQNVSVANAGFGVISSFLTAELGHALHLDGFDGQLFNTAVSGFTTSLLIQVKDTMVRDGLTFAGAIAAIDWTQAVSGAIDVAQLNLGNLLGGYLGHELVPAQTREGAIGGQLFGAIGSFILPGGLGSLIGTILGTWIGNQFGTSPSPGAVDLLDQAGYSYGYSQYQSSDGGGYGVSNTMAQAARDIINAYLHAVDGVALDHGKQATIGYIKNPGLLFISGIPNHTDRSFVSADDAVHAAALDVLQHLEVIGGGLLMKRAHHNSPSNTPEAAPAGGGMPGQSLISGADQLATMAGDLSVAQDYANYLNNREAINALIAANPESAFTAGWIATFARVNDLKLNQTSSTDLLGGLVGFLDSVNKAGLSAAAANASVKLDSTGKAVVEVRVANGTEVPGVLSVFADQVSQSSDATGTTVQFTFNNGLGGNTLLFGGGSFTGTGGHDILIGGASDDYIRAGGGFDFVDGGAGNDQLLGEEGNDILRGGKGYDWLEGGGGDDAYVFNRGDSKDMVIDHYSYMELDSAGSSGAPSSGGGSSHEVHADGGADSLVFGPGIRVSDVSVRFGGDAGNDLIVGIKDPASPGAAPADEITLQNWADWKDRVETFVFADGTTLHMSAHFGTYLVPFGAALSGNTVAENSAIGTVVGTARGFDLDANAVLHYSLVEQGGPFAIHPSTGVITVAGPLDYETATWHPIHVRTTDQSGHSYETGFSIAVTNVTGVTLNGDSGNNALVGSPENDILRGGTGYDWLQGGGGDDVYGFNRGDAKDAVSDSGGADSLLFGAGIRGSDVSIGFGGSGGVDLIVEVRDPANPNAAPTDTVTLLGWANWMERVETFRFADGTAQRRNRGKSRHSSRLSPPACLAFERNARNPRKNPTARIQSICA